MGKHEYNEANDSECTESGNKVNIHPSNAAYHQINKRKYDELIIYKYP